MELNFLNELMNDLNKTNSKNDKIKVLKEYYNKNGTLLTTLMNYVFNYNLQYYVTSANLIKMAELRETSPDFQSEKDLFKLLDCLNSRTFTGHRALALVNGYVLQHPQYKDIIYKVLDKDLKCNIDVKTVNKAVPGCVVTFDVALANKYEAKRMDIENEDYFISHKLDGCLHYDTLIKTDKGYRKIGVLVEDKVNYKVESYNTKTNKVEMKPVLNKFKNGKDVSESNYTWYELTLEDKTSIKLTGNHRVWIPKEQKYKRIDNLKGNEEFLMCESNENI